MIEDINDNTPSFHSNTYEVSISELTDPDSAIFTVEATDPDVTSDLPDGLALNYSLHNHQGTISCYL